MTMTRPVGWATPLGAILIVGLLVPVAALRAQTGDAGDPVAGKVVSARCGACHSFTPGQNKMGPSLAGVVGRKSGTVPDFNYSPAMAGIHLTWDKATLDKYLTNPRAVVPGTKMIFPGIPNAVDRANLIAFLSAESQADAGK
jgi:cytochrome c